MSVKLKNMPIYEFECLDCGSKFDYLVRSQTEAVHCPRCKLRNLKRLISSFSFNPKDAGGKIASSSSGCSGCASHNCSSCGR